MFEYYKQLNAEFALFLKGLGSMYIWNIYKQLSYEILEKCADLKYKDIEEDFKS